MQPAAGHLPARPGAVLGLLGDTAVQCHSRLHICQPLATLHRCPQGPSLGPVLAQQSSYPAQSPSGASLCIVQSTEQALLTARRRSNGMVLSAWGFNAQAAVRHFAGVTASFAKRQYGGSYHRLWAEQAMAQLLRPAFFCVQTSRPPGPINSWLGGTLSSGFTKGFNSLT